MAGAKVSEGGERGSLHQRILSDIRGRILAGEWQPGHRIPFEHELTAEYGCSRMTVNKALSQLAKAGLIERRRRSGSFVTRPRSQAAVLEIHDIKVEVQALGLVYRYEPVSRSRRKTAREDRERIDLPPGRAVLELSCRHLAGGRPFCLEERLINLGAVPEAADESFADVAPGAWLIRKVPWVAAEHRIGAIAADADTAAGLLIAPGSPCLVVERKTWSANDPITHVRLIYPGNSHTLVARFAPQE